MLRRAFRIVIAVLLWIVVVACLAATIVPRFLDRVYYRGPPSGHFDGARFFNPDGEDTAAPPTGGSRGGFMIRYLLGSDRRPPWPARVRVVPAKPPARVGGDAMLVTWIGHASVLVQSHGLNILTDPVWSDVAGPFGFGPRRVAPPGIAFDDLPKIDLILVSHDHYDHLDLASLARLWRRDHPLIVTGLGNDSVLAQAGVSSRALDWGGEVKVAAPCTRGAACPAPIDVVVTRSHHWDSRWFVDRNRALWSSFVVRLPGGNLFFAGDTGAGDYRWADAAAASGPIRLALLPIGAFRFEPGQMASGSHIGPVDAVRVFDRLGATTALPIHWGTFHLSSEGYDTPPRMLRALIRCGGMDPAQFAARGIGQPFMVPPIGSPRPRMQPAQLDRCIRSLPVTQLP